MNEHLKSSIKTILMVWGIVFWIGGIGYMIYSSTDLFMWIVMAGVLIVPIIILSYIRSNPKKKSLIKDDTK
jgi:hypothetical protein